MIRTVQAVIVVFLVGSVQSALAERPSPPVLNTMAAHGYEYAGRTVRVAGFVGCVRESRWCLVFAEPEGIVDSMSFDAAALPAADYAYAIRCGLGSMQPRCPATLTGRMSKPGDGSKVTLGARSVKWTSH